MELYSLVRKYFPNATDEFCDLVLWEYTSFPLGDIKEIEDMIIKFSKTTE